MPICESGNGLGTRGSMDDAPVEVIEKRKKVESELDKGFFFMLRKCAEDFCRVVCVAILPHPDNTRWSVDESDVEVWL